MIELTPEQQREIAKDQLATVHDPRTNETYVLVRADLYQRMKAVIDGVTKRAGWDEPELDVYEQYRKSP